MHGRSHEFNDGIRGMRARTHLCVLHPWNAGADAFMRFASVVCRLGRIMRPYSPVAGRAAISSSILPPAEISLWLNR